MDYQRKSSDIGKFSTRLNQIWVAVVLFFFTNAVAHAACGSISDDELTVQTLTDYNGRHYVKFVPELPGVTLTLATVGTEISISYNQQCMLVPLNKASYVKVNLPNGDSSFDGSKLHLPQRILGGSGSDIIITGNSNDEVYGFYGADAIFTNGGKDFVDAGMGMDCAELGEQTVQATNTVVKNVERLSCSNIAAQACNGIDRSSLAIILDDAEAPRVSYLNIFPLHADEPLTIHGDPSSITLSYMDQCETISLDDSVVLQTVLASENAVYDGLDYAGIQEIRGGTNNDIVYTSADSSDENTGFIGSLDTGFANNDALMKASNWLFETSHTSNFINDVNSQKSEE